MNVLEYKYLLTKQICPVRPRPGTIKKTLRLDDAENREAKKRFFYRNIPLLFLGKQKISSASFRLPISGLTSKSQLHDIASVLGHSRLVS